MTKRLTEHRVAHRSFSPSLIPTKTRPTPLAHPYVLPNQFDEPPSVYTFLLQLPPASLGKKVPLRFFLYRPIWY